MNGFTIVMLGLRNCGEIKICLFLRIDACFRCSDYLLVDIFCVTGNLALGGCTARGLEEIGFRNNEVLIYFLFGGGFGTFGSYDESASALY